MARLELDIKRLLRMIGSYPLASTHIDIRLMIRWLTLRSLHRRLKKTNSERESLNYVVKSPLPKVLTKTFIVGLELTSEIGKKLLWSTNGTAMVPAG